MAGGTKLCPSVYIFSSGVVAAVSPKSYRYMPRVSEGHASGSTATMRTFLPLNLSARKGNASPDMLLPPPMHPITTSGYSPASSICRRASRSEEHTSELQSHHDLVCRL